MKNLIMGVTVRRPENGIWGFDPEHAAENIERVEAYERAGLQASKYEFIAEYMKQSAYERATHVKGRALTEAEELFWRRALPTAVPGLSDSQLPYYYADFKPGDMPLEVAQAFADAKESRVFDDIQMWWNRPFAWRGAMLVGIIQFPDGVSKHFCLVRWAPDHTLRFSLATLKRSVDVEVFLRHYMLEERRKVPKEKRPSETSLMFWQNLAPILVALAIGFIIPASFEWAKGWWLLGVWAIAGVIGLLMKGFACDAQLGSRSQWETLPQDLLLSAFLEDKRPENYD